MRAPLALIPLAAALASASPASPALAGGGGCTTGCPTPPTACANCYIPQAHQIYVPGVTVQAPNVVIRPASVTGGVGGGYDYGGGTSVNVDVSTQTSASAYASATSSGQSYAASTANSQAANLLASSGSVGGGSGGWSEGGSSSNIPSLIVESREETPPPPPPATRQVCAATATVMKAIAIQAVCLDDKAVPHPASQTFPERETPQTYEGELYRCIAGSHMQYVMSEWAGAAHFDHGQTVVCEKNESLWRSLDGRLQCRPQKPARDCNERSLLRRFGAGIKVVKASAAGVCTAWRTEVIAAAGPIPQAGPPQMTPALQGGQLSLDGGVGP